MKKCLKCNEGIIVSRSGSSFCSKECRLKNYIESKDGFVKIMYHRIRHQSSRNGGSRIEYDMEEFIKFVSGSNLLMLFDTWKESGFKKKLKPTVKRADQLKGFELNNLVFCKRLRGEGVTIKQPVYIKKEGVKGLSKEARLFIGQSE